MLRTWSKAWVSDIIKDGEGWQILLVLRLRIIHKGTRSARRADIMMRSTQAVVQKRLIIMLPSASSYSYQAIHTLKAHARIILNFKQEDKIKLPVSLSVSVAAAVVDHLRNVSRTTSPSRPSVKFDSWHKKIYTSPTVQCAKPDIGVFESSTSTSMTVFVPASVPHHFHKSWRADRREAFYGYHNPSRTSVQ